jgi:hypothetical protein
VAPLAVSLFLLSSAAGAAERQIRPFAAVAFDGATTFVNGDAVEKKHAILGVNASWIGDLVGVEGDLGWGPGFFEPDVKNLVVAHSSAVTTATGNVIVTLPRKWMEYTLRPYVVGGVGVIHVTYKDVFNVFNPSETLAAYDIGGGAVGFLTNRVGVAWEVRRFDTLKESSTLGISNPSPGARLSFWRAGMALVVRY